MNIFAMLILIVTFFSSIGELSTAQEPVKLRPTTVSCGHPYREGSFLLDYIIKVDPNGQSSFTDDPYNALQEKTHWQNLNLDAINQMMVVLVRHGLPQITFSIPRTLLDGTTTDGKVNFSEDYISYSTELDCYVKQGPK